MSIQRYIEQLLEEIELKMNIPSPAKVRNASGEDIFYKEDPEDLYLEDEGIPVTVYSKIAKENLPPPEKLTNAQCKKLAGKISELLERWNFHFEFPEKLAFKERYRLIYEEWEEFKLPTSPWHFHMDFCTGDCENCPVKDYCNNYKQDISDETVVGIDDEINEIHKEQEDNNKPPFIAEENSNSKIDKIKLMLNEIIEKDFIHSIHNYCDRWCDKCQMSSKCPIFYFENQIVKLANEDPSKISPSDKLKHTFNLTNKIIEKDLKNKGITIDMPSRVTSDFFPKIPKKEQKVLDYAKAYSQSTSEWLKRKGEFNPFSDEEKLESVNVILYYHVFISAKLARAFFGRKIDPDNRGHQSDSNGSAKITLIAIQKSLDSWTVLLKYYKDEEELILQQCLKLKKLKEMMESFFPNAQKFLRPGFDFIPE